MNRIHSGVRRRGYLVVLLTVVAALIAGLAGASPAAAKPAHHTMSYTLKHFTGAWTSGPNKYTKNQRGKITGFHVMKNSHGCPTGRYLADVKLYTYNPTLTKVVSVEQRTVTGPAAVAASGPCPSVAGAAMRPDGTMQPKSWYNPFSWDWGHIMSVAWNNIIKKCATGALSGTVSTASGTVAVNLMARGGKVFVGPYGYAAIALGGCVAGLIWG